MGMPPLEVIARMDADRAYAAHRQRAAFLLLLTGSNGLILPNGLSEEPTSSEDS